ncbi:molybdopterin-dependent oxidoreductase [Fulvimonas sp. R45]|uniref:xanthine dehydrogenase family protein molybdopterin-binding subunit n=1 Tax=Fulvimonas sp. R45 TaxID=3045937 RepID=UPI00265F7AAB|nr:molybdopterin cofactor-binding domain-containing protein [Fulvimonas sp. R45]MDO1528275.1 molybdopterin-dependent oxidoreductase [Fulvimonas sp. R45]
MNARPESAAVPGTSDFDASRRQFLKTSGGLVLGFSLFGPLAAMAEQPATRIPASPSGAAQAFPAVDPARLDAWLAIHPDNTATLFTGKVEQGNGSPNALAQIAAEELDFPFDRLYVVMGTTTSTVDQGPTYGSMAVRYAGPQIRHAAAAGRQVLLSMASKRLRVPVEQLTVRDGVVSVGGDSGHGDKSRSITYGELVDGKRLDMTIGATGKTFDMKVAPDARPKDPSKYTIVGTSVPRKDIPGKVTGEFTYVHDVKVPNMLHGRVVRPYGIGSDLLEVDESGLRDIPGFVAVVRQRNFLGVVAETEWGAIKAAEKLGSKRVRKGPADGQAKWSDWRGLPAADALWDTLRHASGKDTTVAKRGNVDAALRGAAKTLKATYCTPFETHGSIGPELAIADVGKGYAKFWAGTQMPHQARRDMAELLDLPVENVVVNWVEASGQYGRNGLEPVMADAAIMSRAVGRPVRVQWMRWDSHGWDPKEPPIVQDLEGALDHAGNVVAWRHHMWVPTYSDTRLLASELIGKPVGQIHLGDAAIQYEYEFDHADVVSHGEGRVGLITSWMRAPGQFETTYAMEAFVDELAAAARQDPLAFRLKYLKEPRAIAVLKAAARQYGWESRPAFRGKQSGRLATGRGIAWVNRDGSRVATIADVVVDRDTGGIRVKRVVVAHDCGLVVSPDGLRNQIEGNIIQSISRTLHEEIAFDRAHVTSRDWASYPILRFNEIPDSIEMVFVNDSAEYPSNGGGEPSTCPTAAVISNAVYDATGIRLRQKPFRPERVKAALAHA